MKKPLIATVASGLLTLLILAAPNARAQYVISTFAGGKDGSLNSADSPIRVGNVLVLYATGEGRTTPPGIDGKPATIPLPVPFLAVTAMVGGQQAVVQYAGGAPGFVAGLMQVNVVIPDISPGPAVPVVISLADIQRQDGVTISVAGH